MTLVEYPYLTKIIPFKKMLPLFRLNKVSSK